MIKVGVHEMKKEYCFSSGEITNWWSHFGNQDEGNQKDQNRL